MISVQDSTDLSIFIQIITGLVFIQAISFNLPPEHAILIEILKLETLVQLIELFYYVYFLRPLSTKSIDTMASVRYLDWIISTPIMLLTTIVYLKYEECIENNNKSFTLGEFINDNKHNIITITVSNFFMLFFGYLGETEVIDMNTSLVLGFIFFGITFYTIYYEYAIKSSIGKTYFIVFFSIWLLYGIAAFFDPSTKNHMFNTLDLFAKNFFGVYLYYKAKNVALEQKNDHTFKYFLNNIYNYKRLQLYYYWYSDKYRAFISNN